MPVIHVVMVLIAVGVALWLFDRFLVPRMRPFIVTLVYVVVGVSVGVWLLQIFGLWDLLKTIRTPRA